MASAPSHNISSAPQQRDPLWQLEVDLNSALRVQGAMRAVSNILQPWKSGEEVDVNNVSREDLASLFEVLAEKLGESLEGATGSMLDIQSFKVACSVTERARRSPGQLDEGGTK